VAKKSKSRRPAGSGRGCSAGSSAQRAHTRTKATRKRAAKRASKASPKASRKAKPANKATGKKAKKAAPAKKTSRKAAKRASPAKKASRKAAKKASSSAAGGRAKTTRRSGKKSRRAKTPLTKAQLRHFRNLLLEKRRSLVGDMTGMTEEAFPKDRNNGRDLSMMPDHPANIASDNYEQEFTLGLLESERILLAEIDEALGRIEDGTYGICLGSGEPIRPARLEARPWAKYTVEYARLVEKGLARPAENNDTEDQTEDEEDEDDEG